MKCTCLDYSPDDACQRLLLIPKQNPQQHTLRHMHVCAFHKCTLAGKQTPQRVLSVLLVMDISALQLCIQLSLDLVEGLALGLGHLCGVSGHHGIFVSSMEG